MEHYLDDVALSTLTLIGKEGEDWRDEDPRIPKEEGEKGGADFLGEKSKVVTSRIDGNKSRSRLGLLRELYPG